VINPKGGVKPKVRKAATDSLHAPNQCARAIEYSKDGKLLAVGTNWGEVSIYQAADLKQLHTQDLNKYGKRQVTEQGQNWIEALSFSPTGKLLAVGTHGMVIVLIDLTNGYKVHATLKAHNAAITHLDWSADGKFLQSVCRGYELLFHTVDEKDAAKCAQNTAVTSMKDVAWATQHCTFGWPVQGIFSPSMDGTDVNFCDRSPSKALLATGDDFGNVNLFRYPVVTTNNKPKQAKGHSSHVTRVLFTPDEQYVLSSGGGDKSIFQWKLA
jgi:WD40 repeat protein